MTPHASSCEDGSQGNPVKTLDGSDKNIEKRLKKQLETDFKKSRTGLKKKQFGTKKKENRFKKKGWFFFKLVFFF